jgi:hypothetical protein
MYIFVSNANLRMKLVDIYYVMPYYPPPNKADELEFKVSFKCLST